jgi:hypothetical protein
MNSSICTLFEGHYHYGVAALANSLYKNGFRGSIYAGYKGTLPDWCSSAKVSNSFLDFETKTLEVAEDLKIHFIAIVTDFHLTNYKPFFMLKIWENLEPGIENLAYFDPDIVVKCKWDFFENWMSHGVALVHEIVSNDMPPTHPIRLEWESVIKKSGREIKRNLHSYINGGFCGISKNNIEFLNVWCDITNVGIKYFKLRADQWSHTYNRTYIFYTQDQDALNITAMCSQSPISEIGPEGMDFIHGGFTMSHALGVPKPWKKGYLLSTFKGMPPSLADRSYWINVNGPLSLYKTLFIKRKSMAISVAALIGRFYRRY